MNITVSNVDFSDRDEITRKELQIDLINNETNNTYCSKIYYIEKNDRSEVFRYEAIPRTAFQPQKSTKKFSLLSKRKAKTPTKETVEVNANLSRILRILAENGNENGNGLEFNEEFSINLKINGKK